MNERLMMQAVRWGLPHNNRHELEIAHELCAVVCQDHPGCFEFLGDKWHVYEWFGQADGDEVERFGTFTECVVFLAEHARPAEITASSASEVKS